MNSDSVGMWSPFNLHNYDHIGERKFNCLYCYYLKLTNSDHAPYWSLHTSEFILVQILLLAIKSSCPAHTQQTQVSTMGVGSYTGTWSINTEHTDDTDPGRLHTADTGVHHGGGILQWDMEHQHWAHWWHWSRPPTHSRHRCPPWEWDHTRGHGASTLSTLMTLIQAAYTQQTQVSTMGVGSYKGTWSINTEHTDDTDPGRLHTADTGVLHGSGIIHGDMEHQHWAHWWHWARPPIHSRHRCPPWGWDPTRGH